MFLLQGVAAASLLSACNPCVFIWYEYMEGDVSRPHNIEGGDEEKMEGDEAVLLV